MIGMNGMKKLLRSLAQTLILIVGITFLSFTLSYLSPGDPAQQMLKRSGMMVTEETLQKARHELGLDQPMLVQYGVWLKNLLKGDMGTSVKSRKAVALELGKRLPNTALLALVSMLLVIAISTPVGLLCAWWKDGPLDNAFRFVTYLFASLPSFFISLIMMYVLALRLKWFPVIGSVSVKGIVMPALVLSLTLSAWYIRQVRAIVLREMEKGYIDGLMSRGLSTGSILFRHVLRNCMVPLVTLFGISIGNLMGGATIVESIFSWPGVGKLAVDSITARDYPMIQGYVVWMALIFLAINFLVDLSWRFLDPRIRKGA